MDLGKMSKEKMRSCLNFTGSLLSFSSALGVEKLQGVGFGLSRLGFISTPLLASVPKDN
jgi:hypothetical protein